MLRNIWWNGYAFERSRRNENTIWSDWEERSSAWCFAQLLADSSHLRQRLAIDRDDATHPLNIFRERILRIFHDIFTVQYQTEADMQKLLEQLQYARSSLQQLKEKSVKKKHSLITKIAKAFLSRDEISLDKKAFAVGSVFSL